MADPNMNKNQSNETMQREQAKASVGGGDRKPEQGKQDDDRREQSRIDKERLDKEGREKSAIGGGEKGQSPTGQSGQPGQTSQNREFDKSRSEPTSR